MRKITSCFAILLAVSMVLPFSVQSKESAPAQEKIVHLLNRITFGPSPADIEEVRRIGIDAYINKQLSPEAIEIPPKIAAISKEDTLSATPAQLYLAFGPPALLQAKNGGELPGLSALPGDNAPQNNFRRARGRVPGGGVGSADGARDRTNFELGGQRFVRARGNGFGAGRRFAGGEREANVGKSEGPEDGGGGNAAAGRWDQSQSLNSNQVQELGGRFVRRRGRNTAGGDSPWGSAFRGNAADEENYSSRMASGSSGDAAMQESDPSMSGQSDTMSGQSEAMSLQSDARPGRADARSGQAYARSGQTDAVREVRFGDGPNARRQPNPDTANARSEKTNDKRDEQKIIGQIHRKFYTDLTSARLNRSIYSPRQLEEVMVDFWFNHFNVSFDKGLDHIWVGTYEEHAIRPHALGKFRDLLGATAHHAAMSFYLDNWQNTAPESPGARGKLQGLNENYARELLELHTLGVDGGYTQKDVVELARILTGMGFQRRDRQLRTAAMMQSQTGTAFDANRHDFKDKVLMGTTIKASGEQELEQALDLLAKHKSTANYISRKLACYFVSDNPPPSLVKKLSAKFTATDGDMKAVLSELLHSSEFWDAKSYGAKFKSPYRYLASTMRGTQARVANTAPLVSFLNQSGMPLYKCLTPDGYKCNKAAWLSPDALIKRINLATAFGVGRMNGVEPSITDYRAALELVGPRVSTKTIEAIDSAPVPLRLSLVLGSPEFMMY